jgi:hypothetical protein
MSLFDPIQQLKLSDTFYNWWETTNDISAALNPLNIYDVAAGPGISISRISGGIAVLSVNVGCGLRHDANVSLTLDIQSLPEETSPDEQDNYIIELANSTNLTPSSTDCETFRRVEATNILPFTVSGDHNFIGGTSSAITVSSTNFTVQSTNTHFKDNSIKLGNVAATARSGISSVGFFIDALDEDPTWIYRGDLLAWYTNQNIGISYDQSFVSEGPSGGTNAKFNFSPRGATQRNTEINLLLGLRSSEIITTDVDEAITIRAIDTTNAFDVSFTDTAGTRVPLFFSKYDGGIVLFNISGRIYIEQIEQSSQFLTGSDYSQYKVPLTNTDGIVDYKFTNRYVSSSFEGSVAVGDVVRWNGSQFVRSQANTETNSQIFGVVERISGGKIWIALTGAFLTTSLTSGSTYYLSQSLPGKLTTTKPTTGIVKPVYVAASTTVGVINSSASASSPSFANVQISGGALVDADSVGDTLTLIPGANITIEKNTNNEIEISAASLSQANYFKTATGNTGTFSASGEDTINFIGSNGITTNANSALKRITVTGPNCYSNIQVIGENTGELDYLLQAQQSGDTLYLRSGVGINIISGTDNDILIEATGLSVPADGSITNEKLDDMVPFSIKGAQANGRPVDIYSVLYSLSSAGYTVSNPSGSQQIYTDNSSGTQYPSISSVSGNSILAWAPNQAIAGYAFGRYTDDSGTVSGICALGRSELRRIIGASPTGFLEENANLFNAWYLYTSAGAEKAVQNADDKAGQLVFQEGNNITLTKSNTGSPDNKICIRIDAASTLSGFNSIINNRTGLNIQSSDTNGVLEITDNDAISVGVDSNNGLTFAIKPESITNDMLANMPFNSVKVSVYDTDNPNPIDLVIGQNQVLGRVTGNLKSLTSSELKQILGLTSSNYFKTASIIDLAGNTMASINASSSSEAFALKAGTNITLSKVTGENTFVISSSGGTTGGITTVAVDDTGNSFSIPNPSSLTFGLYDLSDPFSGSNYFNLDYIPSSVSTDVRLELDLALVPSYSVKIAGPTDINRNGKSGRVVSNLVLKQSELLYRDADANTLIGLTLYDIASRPSGGIPFFNTISNGGASIGVSSPGPHSLNIKAGSRVTVSPAYNGTTKTVDFTISSITVVQSDVTPVLGGNLDINSKNFILNTKPILDFKRTDSGTSNSRYVGIEATSNTGTPSIYTGDTTSTSSNVSLILHPQASGNVVIKGSQTVSSFDSSLNLSASVSTDTSHIVLNSNNSSNVNLSASTNKNLTILSSGNGDVRIKGGSNEIISRFSGNNSALITNNTSGNFILVAGSTVAGIPTSGSGSVQFNSDILLSSKSIKAVDNNITVDTVTNDFTGSLKLKATNKSGFWRIKNGSITIPDSGDITGTGGMSSGYLDVINYETTAEKAIKYFMYIQNSSVPAQSAVVEFNVIINGNNFRSLEIVNTMVQTDNSELYMASSEGGGTGIVGINSAVGVGAEGGVDITSLLCFVNPPALQTNEVGIMLNRCMTGTYNITLHKMSIEA